MPQYYVFRSSRSNSLKSLQSINNLRRVGRMLNENESGWRKGSHRSPVIVVNQVQETSICANICQHKCLCAGTTLYAFMWIILSICCIIQCIYRLNHFLFYPTTINIKFEENMTVIPPCVTICASDLHHNRNPVIWQPLLKEAVGDMEYNSTYDLLKKTNLTVNQIWHMSRFAVKNLKYMVIQGNLLSGYRVDYSILEKDIYTVNGVCSTFRPRKVLPCIGMLSGIYIKSNEDKSIPKDAFLTYTVAFHTEDEIPEVRYYGTLGTGVHLPYRQHVNTALKLRLITHLDKWNDPCDSRAVVADCVASCVESNIIKRSNLTIPCRLPYMDETSSLPPCVTAEEFLDIFTSTEEVLRNVHVDTDCSCPKSCESIAYTADYFFREPSVDLFDLFVNFPDCNVEIIEEDKNYGFTALLSDIGGALGLFLGLSMLGVYDMSIKLINSRKGNKDCCC